MDNHGEDTYSFNPFAIPGVNPYPDEVVPSYILDPRRFDNLLLAVQQLQGDYVDIPIPRPYHTSMLTGEQYVAELLTGHPMRFKTMARMSKQAFARLCNCLRVNGLLQDRPRSKIRVEESVLLWLYTMVYNSRQRQTADRYQHSTQSIHDHVRRVTYALCAFGRSIIRRYNNQPHPRLFEDPFNPFFEKCVGAMDGSFIPSILPAEMHMRARHRSGATGHTLMAICDFNMVYTFVNAGWEASAHDGRIFREITNPLERFPFPGEDEFILVDSAFPNVKGFLAPIPNQPYHRSDFEGRTPTSYKQLFNLRHSSLRNVIERAFGVLKGRFTILTQMPRYDPEFQSAIVIACVTMHNYIHIYDGDDEEFEEQYFQGEGGPLPEPSNPHDVQIDQSPATISHYYAKRDQLARSMWGDYRARRR